MREQATRRILVVGAGAIGVVYGYILSLAKVEVTFLIRPHRVEALSKPQTLYNYDDQQLKTFSEFKYTTDPAKISDVNYDYVSLLIPIKLYRSSLGDCPKEYVSAMQLALIYFCRPSSRSDMFFDVFSDHRYT
jgi:UDP-N-acetyl-D-mannosaminuronate dehydrogenase